MSFALRVASYLRLLFCSGRSLFLGDLIRGPSKLFAGNAPELL